MADSAVVLGPGGSVGTAWLAGLADSESCNGSFG